MPDASLVARAQGALDKAFDAVLAQHFAGFVGQVDGDGGKSVKADAAHFRRGLTDLRAAYEAGLAIVDEIFGTAS